MYLYFVIETVDSYKQKYNASVVELEQLKIQNQYLQHQLDQLKRMIFGAKSERFIPSEIPGQLSLEIAPQETLPVKSETISIDKHDRKKSSKEKNLPLRMSFPLDIPREEIMIYPEGYNENSSEKIIGKEITEVLELMEARLFVKQYVRLKFEKKNKEGIVIGELPSRPIDKGLFGERLITQIIVDKYVDHLPLYRQLQRFERAGLKLASSTLSDTVKNVCDLITPLYDLLRETVLKSNYIQVDETPIRVLDRNTKGKTHRGYHWVYHSPQEKMILFDYRAGRGREGPEEVLKNYRGYLQSDGYSVYDTFAKKQGVTLLCCMAHARRKFEQALDNDKNRAQYILSLMQLLYETEKEIRDDEFTAEEILEIRKEKSIPVLEQMETWMKENLMQVLPQSPIGEAIAYALPRWKKLSQYTVNAILQIDNNPVENAIRPVAIGRKNYLFAGSHEGAKRAAMIYSFFGSCKMNGINPEEWLTDVLKQIKETKISQLANLLPGNQKNNQ